MISVVKIKVTYSGHMRSKTYGSGAELVWIYKSKEEAFDKVSDNCDAHLSQIGYKRMREGREKDQYLIDLSFKGNKDIIYLAIEKEIRPLIREKLLTEILN